MAATVPSKKIGGVVVVPPLANATQFELLPGTPGTPSKSQEKKKKKPELIYA